MPPVAAAVATAAAAATATAVTAGATIGLSAAASTWALSTFVQLAAGVALSAISRALMPKPSNSVPVSGSKISITTGEGQPYSFILGRASTAGDLVYVGSHGNDGDTPNAIFTQVIELSDVPAKLLRVWINGEWVTLGGTTHPRHGTPVKEYRDKKGQDYLWVKYHDGRQTVADSGLRDEYGDAERPWLASMVGYGIAYAIVSARFNPDMHRQRPECRFELEAMHYDPRKDSSIGGSGAQRWNNRATWKPSTNLAVLAYNVFRGIRDPITGAFVWGGQDIGARDLPASSWFAAMNVCDVAVAKAGGGTEKQYAGGLEVRVNTEPASVLEELMKGCQGLAAECAGLWTMRAGPPAAAVYGFTDGDVIVTSPDTFDPFPGIDKAYNGVAAQYSAPEDGWELKDAPLRMNSTYLTEDGGRRQIASLQFPAVFSGTQVQRLMASGLKDQRRFRRHSLALPPEARKLGLLDEVAWTSERNGYGNKLFAIDAIEDMPNGCAMLMLRERDPNDYDWSSDEELPSVVNPPVRAPRVPQIGDFGVEGSIVKDSTGTARRPAIRLYWTDSDNVTAVRYRVRLAADQSHVPGNSQGARGEGTESTGYLTVGGERLVFGGDPLAFVEFDDEDALELWITSGILPATAYEVQAIFVPVTGRIWTEWMPVTTPDIRLTETDLADEIINKIDTALANAAAAGEAVVAVNAHVDELDALLSGLSEETLADLNALVAALDGLDAEALAEITGIAIAGLKDGWAEDPTFQKWTAGALDHWTNTGVTTYATQSTEGFYLSSLLANVPTSSALLNIRAASDVAGQIPAANAKDEYVVVSCLIRGLGGSLAGSELRAEWKAAGSGTWVRGHAFGASNVLGNLSSQWGFTIDANRFQSREVIFRRPVGADADAVSVYLVIHQASPTAAVNVRIDYLDIRAATDAEVSAYLANGYTDASITSLSTIILGPSGAIAASANTVRAEFAAADASITSSVVALASTTGALAGRVDSIEATFNDDNLVRNPRFSDGARAAGVDPDYWSGWPIEFSVVARNTGSSTGAIATALTPFIAVISPSGADAQANAFLGQPCKAGERVQVAIDVAAADGTTSSVNVTLRVRVSFYDVAGTFIAATNCDTIITSKPWQSSVLAEAVAPAGSSNFAVRVIRLAGGTSATTYAYFTNVSARFVDTAARALISTATAAAATANNAIATQNTTVSAQFGSYTAFVEAAATAVATADLAASSYVIRAPGGSFGIYSWDDETGVDAAIKLDARNVIAPGTLSAGELVITDLGYNLVPDNQIQSRTAWDVGGSPRWQVIPTTTASASRSVGELRWNYASGTADEFCNSSLFAVRPGQVLTCSFQTARLTGSRMVVSAQMRWGEKDGTLVGDDTIEAFDTTSTSTLSGSNVLTVPSGAYTAAFRYRVSPGTNGIIRFLAPSAIRKESGTTLITPHSITANEAFFESLAALNIKVVQADIVNAAVGTLQIAGNAVTVPMVATRSSNIGTNSTSFVNVVDFDVPLAQAGFLMANASVATFQDPGQVQQHIHRLVIDGTVVFETTSLLGTGSISLSGAKSVAAGNRSVTLQFRKVTSGEPTVYVDRATVSAVGAKR